MADFSTLKGYMTDFSTFKGYMTDFSTLKGYMTDFVFLKATSGSHSTLKWIDQTDIPLAHKTKSSQKS